MGTSGGRRPTPRGTSPASPSPATRPPPAGARASIAGAVPFAGATSGETGLFAEGCLQLQQPPRQGHRRHCPAATFGTMNVRTFTGNAEKSSLQDFVDAVGIDVAADVWTAGDLQGRPVRHLRPAVRRSRSRRTRSRGHGPASRRARGQGRRHSRHRHRGRRHRHDRARPSPAPTRSTRPPPARLRARPARRRVPDVVVTTTPPRGRPVRSPIGATAPSDKLEVLQAPGLANQASGSYGVAYDWLVHKTVVGTRRRRSRRARPRRSSTAWSSRPCPRGRPRARRCTAR